MPAFDPVGSFTKKRLLICESNADAGFFRSLLEHHDIPDFQVVPTSDFNQGAGGNGFFGHCLFGATSLIGFADLEDILLVTDSDNDAAARFDALRHQIETTNARLPDGTEYVVPALHVERTNPGPNTPRMSIMCVPWFDQQGQLEDLCWLAAQGAPHNHTQCVDAFAACTGANNWAAKKIAKMRVRALLSACHEANPEVNLASLWNECPDIIPLDANCFSTIVDTLKAYA